MTQMTTGRPARGDRTVAATPDEPADLPLGHSRHPGRAAATAGVAALLAVTVYSVTRNRHFQWGVVGHYFTAGPVLDGLRLTLELTAVVMALCIPLSILLAVMRLSKVPLASGLAWAFVWFFRSVPGLVQLLIWFNLAALYPRLSFGIPAGWTFVSVDANKVITPFVAAVIGFTLHEAAFMAETFRAAILGVDRGQQEAAMSLGLGPWKTFTRVVLPQAVRFVIPPTMGETMALVKATALVSFIGLTDLLYSVQKVYAVTLQTIPLLLVATIWYLIVTSVMSVLQYYLERHFGRGHTVQAPRRNWNPRQMLPFRSGGRP